MKLLCKKNLDIGIVIIPGKYYKFYHDELQSKHHNVFGGFEKHQLSSFDYYLFTDDIKKHIWFTTNPKSKYYIWDYFYTPQQTRKLKLQKLNEE